MAAQGIKKVLRAGFSSDITLYTAQTPNGMKISITLEELGYVGKNYFCIRDRMARVPQTTFPYHICTFAVPPTARR